MWHSEYQLVGGFCLRFEVSLEGSQAHRAPCIEYHPINLQINQILMRICLRPTLHFASNDWNVWWAVTRTPLSQSDKSRSGRWCQILLGDSKLIHCVHVMQKTFQANQSLSFPAFCSGKLMWVQTGCWFDCYNFTEASLQAIDQSNLSKLESGACSWQ